jgi:hypothetical protein
MNEELQAQALAAWLDACGSGTYIPAPPGLDAEVVEAVYALHPEFARPPRFDMDELLGELTRGPLAAKAQVANIPVVEVRVFEAANKAPAAHVPVATSRHRAASGAEPTAGVPRAERGLSRSSGVWSRWVGSGAVGLMAATAAWLLVVSGAPVHDVPTPEEPVASGPRPAADLSPATEGAGQAEVAAAATSRVVVGEAVIPPAAPAAPAAPGTAPLPGAALAAPLAEVASAPVAAQAAVVAEAAPPPSASGDADAMAGAQPDAALAAPQRARPADESQAYAAAPMALSAGAANAPVIAESEAKSLKDSTSARRSEEAKAEADAELAFDDQAAEPAYTDWRAGLSNDQRLRLEGALANAEAQARRGDAGAGARSLQPFIIQPARAGLNVAARAAELALQANDPRLASSLCERALKLGGSGTAERSRVEALLSKAQKQIATLQLPR